MQTVLRKMGNSTGIIVPKSMLGELGIATGQAIDLRLEDGRIVATPVLAADRAGWATAAQAIGAGDDSEAEAWAGFGNEDDDALTW
jgi:antitoxin MazE